MNYELRGNRFVLRGPIPTGIEGLRLDRRLQVWSLPASWRCVQALNAQGFQPKGEQTHVYLRYLRSLSSRDSTRDVAGAVLSRGRRVAGLTLLPFQDEGVGFLDRRDHALLYDEPGVGKTLQALAWAERDERCLIIAPRAVLPQWADLLQVMGKDPKVQPEGLFMGWGVTNYERLERVTVPPGSSLIVDECHYVKNTKAKRSKLVLELGQNAKRVLALSGTPIINRPIELWPIYLLLRERQRNDFWGFVNTYCGAYETAFGWDFSGATNLDELKDDMLHFAIRRTIAEVLKDLPQKRYVTIRLGKNMRTADSAVFQLLSELRGGTGNAFVLGNVGDGELQKLRIEAAMSKIPAAAEWIQNHLSSSGGTVTVFCGFKEPLKQLAAKLPETNPVFYTGDQTEAQRAATKQAVISGASKLVLLTYGAGGQGLDGLQYGSKDMILLDFPWTPAEVEQAEGRLHRQGQKDSVQVVRFLSGSEIEEMVLNAIDRKLNVIDYLLSTK